MKKLTLSLTLFLSQITILCVSASSYDILSDLNRYREEYHLAPLERNEVLCDLANRRVEQIQTDWSHKQFQTELDKIPDMTGEFHENLARTFAPEDVVSAWSMSLAGHREAMLIPDMKYGCVAQLGDYYTFEGYTEQSMVYSR
jgi:uncharacterized protein YkwD